MVEKPVVKKVDGSFLASYGPYGLSRLRVKPDYSVLGLRTVIEKGTHIALLPDDSLVTGELMYETHTHSHLFRPTKKQG